MALVGFFAFVSVNRYTADLPYKGVIAHAGGAIDGCIYTNSLEAVHRSIDKGAKFIELDLQPTSDGHLVAVHDWAEFRSMVGMEYKHEPLTYEEFMRQRIYGRYHPIDVEIVDSIFSQYDDLILVTDCYDDIDTLSTYLPHLRGRMIIESFSEDAYSKIAKSDFATPMKSGYVKLGFAGIDKFYVIGEQIYERINTSVHYKILTRLMGCPLAVFVLDENKSNRAYADSIMAADPAVKLVYIDNL